MIHIFDGKYQVNLWINDIFVKIIIVIQMELQKCSARHNSLHHFLQKQVINSAIALLYAYELDLD